jgi:molybdenum cofactor biosynthesis enzyme MoaA
MSKNAVAIVFSTEGFISPKQMKEKLKEAFTWVRERAKGPLGVRFVDVDFVVFAPSEKDEIKDGAPYTNEAGVPPTATEYLATKEFSNLHKEIKVMAQVANNPDAENEIFNLMVENNYWPSED